MNSFSSAHISLLLGYSVPEDGVRDVIHPENIVRLATIKLEKKNQ